MPSTRSALARKILGATAAPALLFALAACGDDDDSGDASSDTATGEFCDQVEQLDLSADSVDDVESLEALRELDPPDEIAEDWDIVVRTLEAVADGTESGGEGAVADGTESGGEGPIADRIVQASENVSEYLEGCGSDGA